MDQEEADLQRALALRFDLSDKSLRSIVMIIFSVETAELERIQREGNSTGMISMLSCVLRL